MNTIKNEINNDYFDWMYNLVCGRRYAKEISYKKLLMQMHATEFIFSIAKDENRAMDGVNLRHKYAFVNNCEDVEGYLRGPCSVLEMMIALAIRMEETIMDDPRIGDRTGQWFWGMIANLGLGSMTDDRFDKTYVFDTLARFLNRDYEPDGRGGLFRVRDSDCDLRNVEIWAQMCWYLDEIS